MALTVFFSAFKYPGAWRASADVRTEVTEGAMTEFFYELERMKDEAVPEAELEEVKRSLVARFALSLERPHEPPQLFDDARDLWLCMGLLGQVSGTGDGCDLGNGSDDG